MTILGNGVDIVDNKRIEKAIKNNKKFISRVFSKLEIKNSKKKNNKINYFAKRFAAKEAFLKALGTGISNGISLKDISVKNNKYGKPSIIINDKLKKFIMRKFKTKNIKIFLSLSDEKENSIAFVIINKK